MTKIIDSSLITYKDLDKGAIFQYKEHFYIKISDKTDTYESKGVEILTGNTFSFCKDETVRTYQNIEIHLF